jgi:hypothetical protein
MVATNSGTVVGKVDMVSVLIVTDLDANTATNEEQLVYWNTLEGSGYTDRRRTGVRTLAVP